MRHHNHNLPGPVTLPRQVRPSDHRSEQTTGWMKMGPVDTYSLTGSHKKYAHPATRDVELMLIWSATVAQHQTNIGLTTRGCSTVSQRLWCRPASMKHCTIISYLYDTCTTGKMDGDNYGWKAFTAYVSKNIFIHEGGGRICTSKSTWE